MRGGGEAGKTVIIVVMFEAAEGGSRGDEPGGTRDQGETRGGTMMLSAAEKEGSRADRDMTASLLQHHPALHPPSLLTPNVFYW